MLPNFLKIQTVQVCISTNGRGVSLKYKLWTIFNLGHALKLDRVSRVILSHTSPMIKDVIFENFLNVFQSF